MQELQAEGERIIPDFWQGVWKELVFVADPHGPRLLTEGIVWRLSSVMDGLHLPHALPSPSPPPVYAQTC